jgi:hypothetical protein
MGLMMKTTEMDVIALARQAGLCYPDCNFLDSNPFEEFPEVVAQAKTEAEREEYLRLAAAEEQQRRQLLHKLECFAALVVRQSQAELLQEVENWRKDEGVEFADGVIKACSRLEWQALLLERAHGESAA